MHCPGATHRKGVPLMTSDFTQELAAGDVSSPISSDPDSLLNEAQTSLLLGVSVRTLQGWRLRGCGPGIVKAGRMESNTTQYTAQRTEQ